MYIHTVSLLFLVHVALQASLLITGSGISPGNNATLDCTVRSDNNFMADIQWVGPNGTVLQDGTSVTSLTQSFMPFEISNYGDYTCVATVTSSDFPGVTSTFSSTVPLRRKLL